VVDIPPWESVAELVLAVGGRDEQVCEAIARSGPGRVADLLAAEISTRCDAPATVSELPVNLTLEFGGERFPYVAAFEGGRLVVRPGTAEAVLAHVGYSLLDLTKLMYAPNRLARSTSRDVRIEAWPMQQGGDVDQAKLIEMIRNKEIDRESLAVSAFEKSQVLFQTVHAIVAACSGQLPTLDHLAALHGSDKMGSMFSYAQHYDAHFARLRMDPVRILEIGVGGYNFKSLGGQSLYLWQRYFPRGLIYGMDIYEKPNVTGPRIRTLQGDQSDPAYLREVGESLGPFDIIIDDGSHLNEHVRISYEALFPYVRPGGYYAIEDIQTSYWPDYGGELPPGSPATTIGMVKELIDQIQFREYTEISDDEARAATHPSEVSVYHQLVMLGKGINFEPGSPEWLRKGASMRRALGEL
jgi:MycE methyltransferase N-terminal